MGGGGGGGGGGEGGEGGGQMLLQMLLQLLLQMLAAAAAADVATEGHSGNTMLQMVFPKRPGLDPQALGSKILDSKALGPLGHSGNTKFQGPEP